MGTDSAHLALLLYSEINIVSVVLMLIIAYNVVYLRDSINYRTVLFTASVLAAALSNACDFVWNLGLTGYLALSVNVSWGTNSLYFLSLGACTYSWLMYTEAVFGGSIPPRRFRVLATVPLAALAVLLIVSRFTGCAFYFDETGIYHRGVLFYMQHVLSYGYMVVSSILCLVRALKRSNYDRRDELLAMSAFAVPPLICILLQIYFQTIPILGVGIVVSFLAALISILKNMITADDLTSIPNRRELLHYLSSEIKALQPDRKLYFFFLDIDRFKRTNDEYGHAEGDRALRTLAAVLRTVSAQYNGFCARYGGDEFAVVAVCGSEEDAAEIRRRIHADAERESVAAGLKATISVSIGCAEYTPDMGGIAQLISVADADMYRKKAERHKNESTAR